MRFQESDDQFGDLPDAGSRRDAGRAIFIARRFARKDQRIVGAFDVADAKTELDGVRGTIDTKIVEPVAVCEALGCCVVRHKGNGQGRGQQKSHDVTMLSAGDFHQRLLAPGALC